MNNDREKQINGYLEQIQGLVDKVKHLNSPRYCECTFNKYCECHCKYCREPYHATRKYFGEVYKGIKKEEYK